MTVKLYREDAYACRAEAVVAAHAPEGGVILDRSIFYPAGGGQPGDSGMLEWGAGALEIATAGMGEGESIVLTPVPGQGLPPVGQTVLMTLDWTRRHAHMKVHTALHLLSVALPFGVTGGAISGDYGRLDFDMEAPPEDRDALEAHLNRLIESDAPVRASWITEADLDAQPELVKTLTVKPPRGNGHIRLIRIGASDTLIDLQPCGGTHVAALGEIGRVRLGKIEKKGKMNRRVYLHLVP